MIEGDDGTTYEPTDLPSEYKEENLPVRVWADRLEDRASIRMVRPLISIRRIERRQEREPSSETSSTVPTVQRVGTRFAEEVVRTGDGPSRQITFPSMAYVIVLFVLFPFTLVALFYFVTALRHSLQDWEKVTNRGDLVVWTALLLLELGGVGGFGFLLYWAIVAIDKGVGF